MLACPVGCWSLGQFLHKVALQSCMIIRFWSVRAVCTGLHKVAGLWASLLHKVLLQSCMIVGFWPVGQFLHRVARVCTELQFSGSIWQFLKGLRLMVFVCVSMSRKCVGVWQVQVLY